MEYIFITNNTDIAKYAQDCGVDRIMVDLEIKKKKERQGHLNTLISHHTLNDVEKIRNVIEKSKLLVRVNSIDNESNSEIERVVNLGADIVMLPMFETCEEVQSFLTSINGKAKSSLLLETAPAMVRIDDILQIKGIDEIHIGLNDLHLQLRLKFMFEVLSGGIVEYLSNKIVPTGVNFGFGGIARLGRGTVDSSLILSEHYRLKSKIVILSRDFCGETKSYNEFRKKIDLQAELKKLNDYVDSLKLLSEIDLTNNKIQLSKIINEFVKNQCK